MRQSSLTQESHPEENEDSITLYDINGELQMKNVSRVKLYQGCRKFSKFTILNIT